MRPLLQPRLTGHDTKIFMNSTQPPSKRSQVERTVDRIILFMFALLFAMCIVGCIRFAHWTVRGCWWLVAWLGLLRACWPCLAVQGPQTGCDSWLMDVVKS
jgi:magnesium-transporting ATPase (P-type)